jgi:hypothetical protein
MDDTSKMEKKMNTARKLGPHTQHTHEPRDVPRCETLSLLRMVLHFSD